MTLTWCLDREAWMAIALTAHEGGASELRLKGRQSRPPVAQGGDSMAKGVTESGYAADVAKRETLRVAVR
eukprot:3717739-Pleurochrysis_carterae.AAC.1